MYFVDAYRVWELLRGPLHNIISAGIYSMMIDPFIIYIVVDSIVFRAEPGDTYVISHLPRSTQMPGVADRSILMP